MAPTEEGQVSDCEDLFILTIAAGLSQCLIVDMLNDVMRSGLECFASKGLHGLDFECRECENSVVAPAQEGQVVDCEDLFILTIAAGMSQCLILDTLNDVMWFGLECFTSKGLHWLGFELEEGKKSHCGPNCRMPSWWLCGP